ncbi:MAG: carbon storage regulator [Planctomycetales bacterium]|nr:carbon storage regulator [Planctomycetales bacterium]
MLVLTRKLQEQIRIGDNVVVTVLRVQGNSVRLGVEAPQEVSILRGELPVFDADPQPEANADANETSVAVDGGESESRESDDDDAPTNARANTSAAPALSPTALSLAARVEQCIRQSLCH